MCKVYTGYHGTSEIEHCLCACMVENPSLKLRDYLSVEALKPCSVSHLLNKCILNFLKCEMASRNMPLYQYLHMLQYCCQDYYAPHVNNGFHGIDFHLI